MIPFSKILQILSTSTAHSSKATHGLQILMLCNTELRFASTYRVCSIKIF